MSAIKRITFLLLAVTLAVMPYLALAGARYTTKAVELGVFERKTTFRGSVSYLNTASVNMPVSGATVHSVDVESGQTVKAGDVIATYTVEVKSSDILAAENALNEARDDYEYELSVRESEIQKYEMDTLLQSDSDNARILELKAERCRLTLARYQKSAQAEIAGLEAAYEAVRTSGEPQAIRASIDGVIDTVTQSEAGQKLSAGKSVATIYAPDAVLVQVENPSGELKYGMEVDVQLSSWSSKGASKGLVVSSDNALPGALRSGYAYISYSREGLFDSASVMATTMRVENALLATTSAVSFKDGGNFVDILGADGTLHTRYVVKAAENNSDVWLFMGVNEGDKLVTK